MDSDKICKKSASKDTQNSWQLTWLIGTNIWVIKRWIEAESFSIFENHVYSY